MSDITVGELVARMLEVAGVNTAFGVISIHNMPILDAIGRRQKIRFIPARGEAGAANMADANSRVAGVPGVVITSTGTAAGNAAGAMVEAQTAGTPLLHITGQIDSPWLDKNWGFLHEATNQPGMLKAVSKSFWRIDQAQAAQEILQKAILDAMTPPRGPVSIEIPIDIQATKISEPDSLELDANGVKTPSKAAIQALADRLQACRRPLLWVGGGCRSASDQVNRLVELGFGVVSSTQGRGVVDENHPRSLGAFNISPAVRELYQSADALLVVGSRLRSNETLKYASVLPKPLLRIDVDAKRDNQAYANELFIHADATQALSMLADELEGKMQIDPKFGADLLEARKSALSDLMSRLGDYANLATMIAGIAESSTRSGEGFVWVRDVTISNSTWGNRYPPLAGPRNGVHALGGGIGQGLAMAVGAALAAPNARCVCLVGDGGLQLGLAELATMAQEQVNMTLIIMNSAGYGVIKNIQNVHYEGRNYFTDLVNPDFMMLCQSLNLPHHAVVDNDTLDTALNACQHIRGPVVIEVDMQSYGSFAVDFAGPPVKDSSR